MNVREAADAAWVELGKTKPTLRFTLIDASALKLNRRSPYIVKNIIPTQGLIVIWGPPKCGKSFWTLDLAFHIALGREYRGHRVRQGLAVYIGCEGAFAVPARVEAFRQARIGGPIDPERFKLILTSLDLVAEVDQLIGDIGAQLGARQPVILIIDTLNRALAGSESSDEDMGNFIKAADKLRERFDCAVAIVHDCGLDEKRPRGHTSLAAAADAQIAVKKDASGLITTEVEFLKDGAEGEITASRFHVVENLDFDDDGEPISSCVLDPADNAAAPELKQKFLSAAQRRALELLGEAIIKAGTIPPDCDHVPRNTPCVTEDLWRDYCYHGQITKSDEQEAKRQAFKRAATSLLASHHIGKWGNLVWLVPAAAR